MSVLGRQAANRIRGSFERILKCKLLSIIVGKRSHTILYRIVYLLALFGPLAYMLIGLGLYRLFGGSIASAPFLSASPHKYTLAVEQYRTLQNLTPRVRGHPADFSRVP
jgi:hypothetical protein